MLGIIVSTFHYWKKEGGTLQDAIIEVYKDIEYASKKGLERNIQ